MLQNNPKESPIVRNYTPSPTSNPTVRGSRNRRSLLITPRRIAPRGGWRIATADALLVCCFVLRNQ